MRTSIQTLRGTLAALAVVATVPAIGAPATQGPSGQQIMAKVQAVMMQKLKTSQSYQATMLMTMRMPASMQSQMPPEMSHLTMTMHIQLIPGKKVRVETSGSMPMMSNTVVDDGTTLYTYMPAMNTYMKAPSKVALASSPMDLPGSPLGMMGTLKNYKAFLKGTRIVAGKPAYVVVLKPTASGPLGASRLEFVVDQATYWVRQIGASITMPGSRSAKTPQVMTMTAVIQDEQFDQPIADSVFAFTPPEGAKEMQMPAGFGGMGGGAARPAQ